MANAGEDDVPETYEERLKIASRSIYAQQIQVQAFMRIFNYKYELQSYLQTLMLHLEGSLPIAPSDTRGQNFTTLLLGGTLNV